MGCMSTRMSSDSSGFNQKCLTRAEWRHMTSMASRITGNSITCSTAYSCYHHSSVLRALCEAWWTMIPLMMTSSYGYIFRVTGHLCGEFTGPGEFPAQKPMTRSCDVFFDLRNKRLNKQSWGRWFEMLSRPLWRHCKCQKCRKCVPVMTSHVTHYSDVIMIAMKSQITSVLIVCSNVVQAQNKENIKAPRHWPLRGGGGGGLGWGWGWGDGWLPLDHTQSGQATTLVVL